MHPQHPAPSTINPTKTVAWQKLKQLIDHTRIADKFLEDPNRGKDFTYQTAGLTVDLSKNYIDAAILDSLEAFAIEMHLPQAINALFEGHQVNTTEKRAAKHVQLRTFGETGNPQNTKVSEAFIKIITFVKKIREGLYRGYTNKAITDVVNIGIGGSDLGPRMICNALPSYTNTHIKCHFVSNSDPSDLYQTLQKLDPASTLFIVSSKSFTTQETLANANAARHWILNTFEHAKALQHHLIAITAAPEKAATFGINLPNIFPIWDWVGGRFSLWSAIGLPIAILIGEKELRKLLQGAQAMDEHYFSTPIKQNIPVLMGLLDIWYVNFYGATSLACIPYDYNLRLLPDFLQQLIMESNGKNIDRSGKSINYPTCPAIWGGAGSNSQHSFHQLLHQGTHLIPCDFILPLSSHNPIGEQHTHLAANCLSQTLAMMNGKNLYEVKQELRLQGLSESEVEELAPHKVIPGNRPSTLITFPKTTPHTLGALIAMYEHRVYTASILWNINAFDQWGVELGKTLSKQLTPLLSGEKNLPEDLDSSTLAAIARFRNCKNVPD